MTARLVDSKPQTQSSTIWNKPTARAEIGDYFHIPYTSVMQVVDKEELESGQVWLLLKPTTASYSEEWVLSLFGKTTTSSAASSTEAINWFLRRFSGLPTENA